MGIIIIIIIIIIILKVGRTRPVLIQNFNLEVYESILDIW